MSLKSSPKMAITRFIYRRSSRGATAWGMAFGLVVAVKSAGYAAAYPTLKDRVKIAGAFANNAGLKVLLGTPKDIYQVRGFAVWNTLGLMVIIGSTWAYLLASRTFRGDEVAGRWEVLLSGPTTKRRATSEALLGLSSSLADLFAGCFLIFSVVGRAHNVDFGLSAAAFFALAAVSGAAMFMAVGALASQIMPTRAQAAALSAGFFGTCFILRAAGDVSSYHWLVNISPLGWIENLQPLYGSQPIWLIPISGLIVVLIGLSINLSSQRDLGDSVLADKDTSKPRLGLLNSPLGLGLRLTRGRMIGWLAGLTLFSIMFSSLTKSATQVFSGAKNNGRHAVANITHSAGGINLSYLFLSIVFTLLMLLAMSYVASSLGAMREDEAEGFIDNIVVRPVSRYRWLAGRSLLLLASLVALVVMLSLAIWISLSTQHLGFSFSLILKSAINALVPACFIFGLGLLVFGIRPRLVSLATYGLIAWSFLVDILSSGINLNHWIVDTSLLTQLSIAPASSINVAADIRLVLIAIGLAIVGISAFNYRDLQESD